MKTIRIDDTAEDTMKTIRIDDTAARQHARCNRWIEEHATAIQVRRRARGLMPDSEVIACIRRDMFEPLANFRLYEPITEQEVRGVFCGEHGGTYRDAERYLAFARGEVSFSKSAVTSITDRQLDHVEKLEALLPGARIEIYENIAHIEENAEDSLGRQVRRLAIQVSIHDDDFTFAQCYMLR